MRGQTKKTAFLFRQRVRRVFAAVSMVSTISTAVFFGGVALDGGRAFRLGLPQVAFGAPRIHVHGTSSFDVTTSRGETRPGDLRLNFAGTLKEDTGRPLAQRTIQVSVREGTPDGPQVTSEPCRGPAASDARSPPGTLSLLTDASGRFCVSVSASGAVPYVAHLVWSGDAEAEGAVLDAVADPSHRALQLEFDPVPNLIDLDNPSQDIFVQANIRDGDARTGLGPVLLTLLDERGNELGRTTVVSRRATFHIPRENFGPPGQGELRAVFDGDELTSRAVRVTPIARRTTVVLSLPTGGPLGAIDPDDGLSLALQVLTSGKSPVSTGIVEASVDGFAVGSAPVQNGRADLVASFDVATDRRAKSADLRIRYVSDAPWLAPGDSLDVSVPFATEHPVRRSLLLMASLGVVLWLALARRRPTLQVDPAKPKPALPRGKPGVAVVRSVKDVRAGWSGRIVDAHDGTPLVAVEVRLERPFFTGVDVLARASSGETGRFEIRHDSPKKGDRLAISAPFHVTLEQPLPTFGELEIALVARKRALLDRLVDWVKRAPEGKIGRGEPTPGQLARKSSEPEVVQWARAVEEASFGPDPVDATTEAAVDGLSPHRR